MRKRKYQSTINAAYLPNTAANTNQKSRLPFSVVEAYKNLRVHLTSALAKSNGKIFAVSSSNAAEGKSTTAINIALMLSQLNKKVLLIDTDARRPTVHTKLKLDNELGCLDYLSNNATLDDIIKHHTPYMDVITAGTVMNNASELFDSMEFDRMLASVQDEYSYIVLDTPPIILVSDSLVIAKKCDGLLLVVRTGATTYGSFRKSIVETEKLGINIIGAVMNGEGSDSSSYYKYSKYNKYQKYGNYNDYNNYGYSNYGYANQGYGYAPKNKEN